MVQIITYKSRKRRFYVLKVSPLDFLNLDGNIATPGELANVPITVSHGEGIFHRDGYEYGSTSGRDKAAWYLSNLSVTFMVDPGVDPSQYADFNQDIVQVVEPKNPIRESDFDIDFTTVNLLQESVTSTSIETSIWRKNFTPFTQITIDDRIDKNLQGYKTDDLDRQICSSPTTIRLKVDIIKVKVIIKFL